ncbi:MAG: hypothetical protein EA406_13185 [Rhodospirillales bacterium]|nr:MAG: hypothetical protein EA406_13185 [Rhodospirillales bacterium]
MPRTLLATSSVACAALLIGALGAPDTASAGDKPAATVVIDQVQVAFIGSGNIGGGTLTFEERDYDFTIGGLGIGGVGVSRMTATGEVFGLQDVRDFEGAYVQGRYGAVAGDIGAGALWLQNDKGVSMHLAAKREGLALSLGGDAVYIKLD